jgi:hypothetical protein
LGRYILQKENVSLFSCVYVFFFFLLVDGK